MADVIVNIGATTDQLDSAVSEAKGKFTELQSSAEEASGRMKEAFAEVGTKLTELLGLGGIAEFIKKEMELGENTLRMSRLMGESVENIAGLKVAAEAGGTSLEAMSMATERMRLNIERSTRDALSPQAQALRNLGLTAEQFIGKNGTQSLRLMMEAAERFGGTTGTLRDNIQLLVGRNQNLVAMIMEGTKEFDRNTDAGKKNAGALGENVEALRAANTEWIILKNTILNAGVGIAGDLNRGIKEINALIHGQGENVKIAAENWDRLKAAMKAAVEFAPRLFGVNEAIDKFAKDIPVKPTFITPKDVESIVAVGTAWQGAVKPVTEYNTALMSALQYMDQLGKKGVTGAKPEPPGIQYDAKAQLEAFIKEQEGEVEVAKQAFERKKAFYALEVAQHKESQAQMAANVAAAEHQMAIEVEASYRKITNDARTSAVQRVEFENKIRQVQTQDTIVAAQQMTKETQDITKEWQGVATAINGPVNSAISGLVGGTETLGNAFQSAFIKLLTSVAEALVQLGILLGLEVLTGTVGAPGAAASAYGGDMGRLAKSLGSLTGLFPSKQEGTVFAQGGLAMLHQGEMVLPPSFSEQIRAGTASLGGGAAGNTANISISALDARSVQGWLNSGGGKMIAKYFDQNANSRPSY